MGIRDDVHFIPISALNGDNVVDASPHTAVVRRRNTLMHMLENVQIASDRNLIDFRFPVQYVNRPNLDFRGFCGTVASGVVRKGDEILVLPSRKTSKVKSIVTFDGELEEAFPPMSITLTLEDEVDVSRGDTIVHTGNVPQVGTDFDAMVVWMDEDPMVPGKQYLIKQCNKISSGSISTLRYQVDVNSLHRKQAPTLSLNEIGRCEIQVTQPFIFDGYRRNRGMGSFIVIDRMTNRTVAAGMILDRTTSEKTGDHWDDEPKSKASAVDAERVSGDERQARFGQLPCTILLTGLSGAGKTTTAHALERRLFDMGRTVTVLDGQDMRQGISRDLGFTADARSENLRRSAEVAKLMNQAGVICLCAFGSPREDVRLKARDVVGADRFLIVHLDAPVEVCRERDTEGLYGAADAGDIANFPGVSSNYEPPEEPDLYLETDKLSVDECVEKVLDLMAERSFVKVSRV